jgi:hypothetical protein
MEAYTRFGFPVSKLQFIYPYLYTTYDTKVVDMGLGMDFGLRFGKANRTEVRSERTDNQCRPDVRVCSPLMLILSLLSSFQLALEHLSQEFLPYFWESYSKRYFLVKGGSSPLSLPPSTSQAPSLEEHKAKGQEEKGR